MIPLTAAAWMLVTPPARRDPAAIDIAQLTSFGDVIDAVVAPDGKYLAFVRSFQGRQSLWIRQLRGTNPIELVAPAPVNYFGMAFAPDSGSIYYVVRGPEPFASAAGMLFNIPALGGLPKRLGTAHDRSPAVSPDGTQIASVRADHPSPGKSALIVTRADGTGARTLLVKDEPELLSPGFFVSPSWSPSGDRIAVTTRNYERPEARVHVVDLATSTVKSFARTFSVATFTSWLPDGSGIVFVAADKNDPAVEFGSRIWIQPLPDGPPRPLTSGLVEYRNATVTADGAALVSVGSINNATVWSAPLVPGERLRKIPSMNADGAGGIARLDEDTIVFTSGDGGSLQLWTMRMDGSNRRQLTSDGWNVWPRPTRDGKTIFFVSDRAGRHALWRMNRDGSGARQLASASQMHELTLTPDERSVVFTATGPDRMDSTWRVPAEGGEPELLVRGLVRAAFSPDGRLLAGVFQDGEAAEPVLAVFPAGGGAARQTFSAPLKNAGSYPTGGSGGVWWTRDGSALLYTNADRMNVWRQPIAGGPPVQATDFGDGSIIRGELSPDGRSMLMCRGLTLRDAYLISGFR